MVYNDVVSCSDYVSSNNRMIYAWWIGKKSGRGLIKVLTGICLEESHETYFRIVSARDDVWSRDLPNTNEE
jgi:hypothetical protein